MHGSLAILTAGRIAFDKAAIIGRAGCLKFNCAVPERAFATMEREAGREWKRRQIFNRQTGA